LAPGSESSGSEMTRERMDQGAKGPGSKLASVLLAYSLLEANWPRSEKAVNRIMYMLSATNDL